MALNKTILGNLMQQKVHAIGVVDSGNEVQYFEALAEAIIEHFTIAGIVNTTVNTAVVATIGVPPAVAGTGAGAGIGKIS